MRGDHAGETISKPTETLEQPTCVALRVDSATHPDPIARIRAWQAATSVSMETLFEPDDIAGFVGSLSLRRFGSLILVDLAVSASTAVRRRSTRLKWEHDHIVLDFIVSGTMRGEIGGRPISYAVGDCVMFDLKGGMRLRLEASRVVGLIIPRALFREHASGPVRVDGRAFLAESPEAQVLGGLLTNVAAQAPRVPVAVAEALARTLVGVTAACVVPDRSIPVPVPGTRHGSPKPVPDKPPTLAQVRRAIDREAAHSGFGVGSLCAEFGLSRTALYRLFEPAGGVAEAIRRRRAALAVRLLTARTTSAMTVAYVAEASGFGHERSLRHALRELYAASPREIRRAGVTVPVIGPPPDEDFGRWFDEL